MTEFEHLLEFAPKAVPYEPQILLVKSAESQPLWRYACPHCGGTNALNGDPTSQTLYRGSAKCQDCKEGFAAVNKTPLGKDGPPVKTSADHQFTLAVDLDGTLANQEKPFNAETIGTPRTEAIDWVQQFHEAGARIIIYTVRGDKKQIKDWLDENEVPFHFINENPDQPEGSSGKVLADAYWDDRAFNAKDPDEHGPALLDQIVERASELTKGAADDSAVALLQQSVTIVLAPDLLKAMA